MRWGVYARNAFEGADAWRVGALAAGHRAALRSVSDFSPGDSEDFDAVAVFGLQGKGPAVLSEYKARGVPVVVIDYGYVRRCNHAYEWRTGYWQVSLGGLNRLPPAELCDSSRWDALGVSIVPSGGDPSGYRLLAVQTTGDASHGMDEVALQHWCSHLASIWPDLVVRPHPLQEHLTYGLPTCEAATLDEALAGARLVVTGNSNTGHDALLAGVPAVAMLPGAAWADLSGPNLPSMDARREHFARCAWGQWTWDEFRAGLPHRFLADRWIPSCLSECAQRGTSEDATA
jgi:hypothetical protein